MHTPEVPVEVSFGPEIVERRTQYAVSSERWCKRTCSSRSGRENKQFDGVGSTPRGMPKTASLARPTCTARVGMWAGQVKASLFNLAHQCDTNLMGHIVRYMRLNQVWRCILKQTRVKHDTILAVVVLSQPVRHTHIDDAWSGDKYSSTLRRKG